MKKQPISPKRELFCHEYLKTLNASKAGKDAGFADSTAVKLCPGWVTPKRENSTCVEVWDRVQELKDKRAKECDIDAKWVLDRLIRLAEVNIDDFLVRPEEGLPYYDFSKATREQMSVIESLQIDRLKGKIKVTLPREIDVLKLIGQHISVNAFKAILEHSGPDGKPLHIINTEMSAEEAAKIYAQEILEQKA